MPSVGSSKPLRIHEKMEYNILTHLTRLIHTSFLPSNWNLDKHFALTCELGHVQMAKKYICDFPP